MDEHLDWKLSAPSDWITSDPVVEEDEYDLLADGTDDSAPVVEHWTLGTDDFRLPDGPDDAEVWLMKDSSGADTTIGQLRALHEEMKPRKVALTVASETVVRPMPQDWRPYERERDSRKTKILAYVREFPGQSGNKVITAVGGNRNRLRADINELVADGLLVRIKSGLYLPE